MSSSNKSFRVIIAGGGVAGLTLANMLERFDIDYVMLEGYGQIAPAVGASIGMFPNGLRILDQIDLYDPLKEIVTPVQYTQSIRDMNGRPISSIPRLQEHVVLRHGYPLMFLDRQSLLKILYERLRHKDRVLLNRKVETVGLVHNGVEVTTTNGETIKGSILVGADGVHSSVRRNMFRLGQQLDPGTFAEDELNKQECHYLCSYGIAQDVPGWVAGDQCAVLGKGHSQLVVSGPDNKTYWFFFSKLPETKYGKDIPGCSKGMEDEFLNKYAGVPITEKVNFGQVFAKRLFSTLTPLHEYVFDKWFFKRIVCLGDSMHKPNPIGGQGGNGAIESAAELVNAIIRRKQALGSLEAFSDHDIEQVFREMQSKRHDRAKLIVSVSHLQQYLVAYEKPLLSKFVCQFLVPLIGDEAFLAFFGLTLFGASRLEALPVKDRPRAIPYRDELPAPPLRKSALVRLFFSILMLCFFYKSLSLQKAETSEQLPVDQALQLISPLVVYTLEGYRLGNSGTPLAMPGLFLLAVQYYGIHRVAPIYAIFHALMGASLPTGRFVRPDVVFSMLVSLAVTFVLPVICSTPGSRFWQTVINLAPVITSAMTFTMSYALRYCRNQHLSYTSKKDSAFERYTGRDLGPLWFAYACTGITQAATHILSTAPKNLKSDCGLFHGLTASVHCNGLRLNTPQSIFALSIWCSNIYTIWNMRRLGYITTNETLLAVLFYAAGYVVVGPGAAWMGVWCWRENAFARFLAPVRKGLAHDKTPTSIRIKDVA
ncbi:hypothetical protein ACHAP7_011029 [Fusarium lateritium]